MLERLAVSCYVDVDDLFEAYKPIRHGLAMMKLLESHCQLVNQEVSSEIINKMLVRAGNAALRMPRLTLMHISEFYSRTVNVRYQVEASYAT